jgi:hypothetical protein
MEREITFAKFLKRLIHVFGALATLSIVLVVVSTRRQKGFLFKIKV